MAAIIECFDVAPQLFRVVLLQVGVLYCRLVCMAFLHAYMSAHSLLCCGGKLAVSVFPFWVVSKSAVFVKQTFVASCCV